ncbi:hypothetical protein EBBID32_27340 [Sphingobium indicum BiD32]|uniref:Uncharacterized protein n=1 Tax=Sphingobium indicum BiD32 TaxID=1301087 RepID=N1MRU3_9SPHN|nr:hypothetical protein EBBID32_27340 [Sphingobium indicum BiD32]
MEMRVDQAIGTTGTAALTNRLATMKAPTKATAVLWNLAMDMVGTP